MILPDINMPGLDGPQVLGEIKSALARSPGGDGDELTPGRTKPHKKFTNKVVGDHAFG